MVILNTGEGQTETDRKTLDGCEGYAEGRLDNSYDRQEIIVQNEKGSNYPAIVYLRSGKKIGEPSEKYRNIVITGALDCKLTETYINSYLR